MHPVIGQLLTGILLMAVLLEALLKTISPITGYKKGAIKPLIQFVVRNVRRLLRNTTRFLWNNSLGIVVQWFRRLRPRYRVLIILFVVIACYSVIKLNPQIRFYVAP